MTERTPNLHLPADAASDDVSPFDRIRRVDEHDREHWSARELMPLLGYTKWQRFAAAIERAMAACANAGGDTAAAFTQVTTLTGAGNLGDQAKQDYQVSRYAAYLIAMNGDPRKAEIASAQTYFAVKTREAEAHQVLDEIEVARRYLAALETKRELQATVTALAPDAESWRELATAHGDYSVGDAAKILARAPGITMGRTRLFNTLKALGWTHRSREDGSWRAYQSAIDKGWLSELPQSHHHPRTGDLVLDPPQLRVTVNGIGELRHRLAACDPLMVEAGTATADAIDR